MIPHSRPVFGQPFSQAVQQVIASGQVAMGEETILLEQRVASMLGRKGAVAVDSGTSAITLALRVLAQQRDIKKVGIPAYTCSSVLYAVRAAGCEPVCMDCGDDLRLIPEKALSQAAALDVVVLVHPFGMVEPLAAESWPCPVIEDIAQAAGAELNGKPVGSFGDVAVASFYATKPWGGAYGGMVLSDDAEQADTLLAMRDPDAATVVQHYVGHHQLSDIHAVMANVRFGLANEERRARKAHALTMDEWFESDNALPVADLHQGNGYRYIIRTEGDAERWIERMRRSGVAAARPVQQPISRMLGVEASGAESAWQSCVSIPLLADASEKEMEYIREAVACMS